VEGSKRLKSGRGNKMKKQIAAVDQEKFGWAQIQLPF
jgi:hypothetical protein